MKRTQDEAEAWEGYNAVVCDRHVLYKALIAQDDTNSQSVLAADGAHTGLSTFKMSRHKTTVKRKDGP